MTKVANNRVGLRTMPLLPPGAPPCAHVPIEQSNCGRDGAYDPQVVCSSQSSEIEDDMRMRPYAVSFIDKSLRSSFPRPLIYFLLFFVSTECVTSTNVIAFLLLSTSEPG